MGQDADAEPTLKELIAARDKVQREIDVLTSGAPPYSTNRDSQVGGLIDELSETLRDLEQCIADWKDD